MRRIMLLLLIAQLVITPRLIADDIDALLPAADSNNVFLHVLLDTGNVEEDAILCTVGESCAPPFMSAAAYRFLRERLVAGSRVTAQDLFLAVLKAVLDDPLFRELRVSILLSNHQDNHPVYLTTGVGGGTVLQGYRSLGSGRESLFALLDSLPQVSGEHSHAQQPREAYLEWLRYIAGEDVLLGDNTSGNFGQVVPIPDYDASIITAGKYLTPFTDPRECPQLYSILFSSGTESRDDDTDAEIASRLSLTAAHDLSRMLDFLHDDDAGLVPQLNAAVSLRQTWIVSTRGRDDNAAFYAQVEGVGPVLYVEDPNRLQLQLGQSLAQALNLPDTLQEVSFVEDTFRPGRVLDDLFLSMAQPRRSANWQGNLKKLRLVDGDRPGEAPPQGAPANTVVDALGNPAFQTSGPRAGSLRFDALTLWTDDGTLPPGDGIDIPVSVDGRVVSRGGAGQKIDGFVAYASVTGDPVGYFIGDTNIDTPVNGYAARQVYYEGGNGQGLVPFDAEAESLAGLRSLLDPGEQSSDEELLELIRWGRGQQAGAENGVPRKWLLGGLLHSRPYALNYGATTGYSPSNPNVRLMFGSGEGMFHIVENTGTAAEQTGREVFAFYPAKQLEKLSGRRLNALPAARYRYGVDGAPSVLKVDRNGDGTLDHSAGDEAYVYFGIRRGGASYYALDVSDPDGPPTLLWKISPTTDGDFDELALTFSTPLVGRVNYGGVPRDVVIFSGGYNGGWNASYTARIGKDAGFEDDHIGNAIYIVDARTGGLVWKAVHGVTGTRSSQHYEHSGLVDSIPADVSALRNSRGVIHRLYVGDTGGALWRIDLPENFQGDDHHRQDSWFISKIADLGADAGEAHGAGNDDRRFFHAVDIVRSVDAQGEFDGVLVQSGDRAHPDETLVDNYLFYIKDRQTESGAAAVQAENGTTLSAGRVTLADLPDQSPCVEGTELPEDGTASCADRDLTHGWKLRYLADGEKGMSQPVTDSGRVFVTTYTPGDSQVCPPQRGRGAVHVVNLRDATAAANKQRVYDIGPGLPGPVVSAGELLYVPGAGIDIYDLDNDGSRDVSKLLPSRASTLYGLYWREPGIDPL